MTKIIRQYPTALTDAQTQNEAPAVSDVVQALAGRARSLYELATGGGPNAGAAPATPRNPQGLYGVDMSGPPWGTALLVPIATMHGINDANLVWTRGTSAPVSQEAQILTVGGAGSPKVRFDQVIWHKPFARGPGLVDPPLSRGCIAFRARQASATATVLTFTLRVDDDDPVSGTFSMPASTTTANYRAVGGDEPYFRLRPGPQRIRMEISSSSASVATLIWALSICQIAKRSH